MKGLEAIKEIFPHEIRQHLEGIPTEQCTCIQEIRLRRGQPVTLTVRGRSFYLSAEHTLVEEPQKGILCRGEWLEQIFDNACDHSVYAHQEELCHGYVTTRNGCRVGIGGTAVTKDGAVCTFRNITSLCLRVAREHVGCSQSLLPLVCNENGMGSLLICGEPSCGKTSLLKDLLWQLADRQIHAAVIDERGELRDSGIGAGCDVLSYIPKAQGIEQAVRCLAPPLIVLDELGNDEEIEAVADGLYRGVPTVATLHCRTAEELLKRRALITVMRNGAFDHLIFLEGRAQPGKIRCCVKTGEWLHERDRDDIDGVERWYRRIDRMAALATAGERITGT